MLLRNPGKLLSHRQLLHDVWGPGYDNAGGNLRLYMAQLRRKLEQDPARPRWLITEPGMGYRYQPPDPASGRRSQRAAVREIRQVTGVPPRGNARKRANKHFLGDREACGKQRGIRGSEEVNAAQLRMSCYLAFT